MKPVDTEKVIKTKKIRLEPILPAHAIKLYHHLLDKRLYTFIPVDPPESVDKLEKRYSRWSKRQSDDGSEIWLNFAIYHLEYSDYVGTLQATLYTGGENYIAYEVFPDHWREGIAKEACSALLALLYHDYKITGVTALIDTRNTASYKLVEALGFTKTGVIHEADFFKNSKSDEYIYKINLSESIDKLKDLLTL